MVLDFRDAKFFEGGHLENLNSLVFYGSQGALNGGEVKE